jgi:demethylmenaquinone methyltransferase/2-methoxy-6-polyprenyl-1,4-benzoquinol methylase
MTDTDTYIKRLEEANPLREPLLRTVVQTLGLPAGSRGLDVGCGIGLQALLLAEAVGSDGHVTGLDLSPALLHYAEKIVRHAGLSGRISCQEGDLNRLPFDDDTFDWIWSADCVGYPVSNLLPVLLELRRVVKPGGTIAILAWSSQCLLPGYPLLEARLNATGSGLAPIVRGSEPESHFLRALRWFAEAGLVEAENRTFVGDVQAPLSDATRTALISLFEMLWGEPAPEVSQEDWAEYQRLCQPESPDFILDLPGYVAFFTYSLFRGTVAT